MPFIVRLFCLILAIYLGSPLNYAFASATNNGQLLGTKLTIIGVEDKFKNNILNHLRVDDAHIPLSAMGFPRTDNFIVNTAEKALQALGYYQAKFELDGDHQSKTLAIELGKPMLWRDIVINLNCPTKAHDINELLTRSPFRIGQIIHHGEYNTFKNSLISTAQASGFLNARFEHSQLNVDLTSLQADINWQFTCGKRYTINNIFFDNSVYDRAFIFAYLKVSVGDDYNQDLIFSSQQALNRSGFFKSVTVEQSIDHDNNKVDLTISAIETDKYELKTLLGYGTDSGGKLGFSWQNRRVNKRAHSYIAGIELSNVKLNKADINATFQYKIPLRAVKSQWINRASYQIKNEELGQSKTLTIDSSILKQLDPFWSSQLSITLAKEILTTDANINQNLEYLVPAWQLNYYSVADPFTATEGWRWQSLLRFSTDELSDPDMKFIQTDQRIKSIWSLNEHWRLLVRGRIGATWMDTEQFNQSMPSNYRFFAGGDISIRGYAYQSLSPAIDDDLLGGKHLVASSIEIDYLFKDNYRVALFADQGNAFNNWHDFKLYHSVGTGFRWVTPIGAIRFDLAKALDGDKGWRLHLTIGPDL